MRVGNLPGIRRLPMYLNLLRECKAEGMATVSATALAARAGLVTSVVRKDLEMTGATGITGIGYSTDELIAAIQSFLGWGEPLDAFLVGAGSLGSALLGYPELRATGLNFVAAFDPDPRKVGTTVHGIVVLPLDKLENLAARMGIGIAVLTVPSGTAQAMADILVKAGVTRIWSFASEILQVPDTVTVQRQDLSAGLAELLVKAAKR